MVSLFRILCIGAALVWTGAAFAQFMPNTPILTLDQDRLYVASKFGQRVQEDLQAESAILSEQNRQIEAALEEEEQRLTDERPTMDPIEFGALARDFDERVTGIRRAQSAKSENIRRTSEAERTRFFEAAFPVLLELVEETGAIAILNNSAVIFSVRQIDITDIAIERVDAAIGDAPLPVDPGPAPLPRPEPDAAPVAPAENTDTTDQ